MEKVGEGEEKTIGEASNSTEETRSEKEDERIRDTPVDYTEQGSKDPSNSQTVTFEDHDVNEYEMEDEEVLELFRRNSGLRSEFAKSNVFPYLNKSEEMVLQFQEDTPSETEQANVEFHSMDDSSEVSHLGAENLLEGIRSSSDSKEDTDDSSSDSNLSSYYFDGSLPASSHVEEPETHQDESPVPKDENQMPLLHLNQPVEELTSWRSCCGLLELLRAAEEP